MQDQDHPYINVYSVLDEFCFSGAPRAGVRGRIFSAIDQLRREAAPADHVALAERIAVAVHRLEWAILTRSADEKAKVRQELQELGSQWHQMPLPVCLN